MALISCKECGHQVSDQAASCPKCGHPIMQAPSHRTGVMTKPKRGTSGCAIILLGGIIVVAMATCISITSDYEPSTSTSSPATRSPSQLLQDAKATDRPASARLYSAQQLASEHPGTDEGKEAAQLINTLQEEARLENLGKQWIYSSHDDAMTSKKSHQAVVRSTNIHEFSFPYHRPQRATLTVRDHPRFGKDVIFEIERGQLQCSNFSGCDVLVRFGDAPARRYSGNEPEDNSTEMLFINNSADFRRRMQAVDVVRVSVSTYQQGSPTWEFDVSGFNPDKMRQP